jgi:hypothetical protein
MCIGITEVEERLRVVGGVSTESASPVVQPVSGQSLALPEGDFISSSCMARGDFAMNAVLAFLALQPDALGEQGFSRCRRCKSPFEQTRHSNGPR